MMHDDEAKAQTALLALLAMLIVVFVARQCGGV